MTQLKPSQSINKAYRQVPIETSNYIHFCNCLRQFIENVSDGQSEETQKGHLQVFLADTFYKQYYMVPEGDIDVAIHLDSTAKSNIGLLIEVKSTTNTNEMITREDLNKKALQELLLYYLRERVTKHNSDLKYLIATNIYEYFIFDAQVFEKQFYSNSYLVKEFNDFEEGRKTSNKTSFFYEEIASKYIAAIAPSLDYTYFDIRDYQNYIDSASTKQLSEIYRLFSDTNLLKLPFQNDSNSLDKSFYDELLHIIGLEEQKEGSKVLIVRKGKERRNDASLLEGTINVLDSEDRLDSLSNLSFYGADKNEQLFNVAMELCITWINRLLFLKLLEAQLIKYHNGNTDYKFLTIKKIPDYDELNRLFFQVLARDYSQRTESVLKEFKNVPYLNSSLFEICDLEKSTICINNLPQSLTLPLLSKSVLRNKKHGDMPDKLPTLQYIFAFLDSFNFSSEGSDDIQDEAKTLINASVLGLIFEKINGHKDGAIFTPGFITMFMSKESIDRVVIQKFNEKYGWTCETLNDLYNKDFNPQEANDLINSIKICDPAVGSGHYLVSVLNEIIRIKYELGILTDKEGKRIKKQYYTFSIENDELIVTDEDNNLFRYVPGNIESQRIQELLFNEKRNIIEHCLFGVDINPNSVRICRLRLWIELLKNAFYTQESSYTQLETLPNIDINIKQGNSLLHRFKLEDSIDSVLKDSRISISDYKEAVSKYRNASNKDEKHKISNYIEKIKSTLRTEIDSRDSLRLQLSKKRQMLKELQAPELFEITTTQRKEKEHNIKLLTESIHNIESHFKEIQSNRIYQNAFEWRIEFPEVLDNEGNFIGFDCIIGNPPYIQLQIMGKDADALEKMNYKSFARTGDMYCLFYEFGVSLLRDYGILCFITSNKWMRAGYGSLLRTFLANNSNPIILIDFAGNKIFETATVDNNILLLSKESNRKQTLVCAANRNNCLNNLSNYFTPNSFIKAFDETPCIIVSHTEQAIKEKIESVGRPLEDWNVNIFRGILTGLNDAFIITTSKRNEIISHCSSDTERQRTADIIRPILRGRDIRRYGYKWADLWIINIHNGVKEKNIKPVDINNYPAIKSFLDNYWFELSKRKDKGDTPYNLRNCAYLEDFSLPKIIYPNMTKYLPFVFDDKSFIINQKCFFITGDSLFFLTAFLNSSLFKYCFRDSFPELQGGTREMSKIFFDKIPIIPISESTNESFRTIVLDIQKEFTIEKIREIDQMIFDLYNLTTVERETIGYIEIE